MNTNMIIEAVGYLGSLLVLVSFLMVSVVKLRVVNTVGSFIFMVYALIIRSYPTAIMNFCLVLINLRFLYRLHKADEKNYDLVHVDKNDSYLRYFLDSYGEDIEKCFPGNGLDLNEVNRAYMIVCEGKPVGLTLGRAEDEKMELLLDYSIPQFRDLSIGKYLYGKLPEEGIRTLIYNGPTQNHLEFLEKMGFVKEDNGYIKRL